MSLRDKLGISGDSIKKRQRKLYETFGVGENPFPPASQPMGHSHMEADIDGEVLEALKVFVTEKATYVIVIEGTQGTGKTNLLEYYANELTETFDDEGYYIIRYCPDPEQTLDSVIRMIIQAFGEAHFRETAVELARQTAFERRRIISNVRSHEVQVALESLVALVDSGEPFEKGAFLLFEWFLGLRLLKRHTEVLGVKFRLDTVESKTQALHDLVYVSHEIGKLNAIFLLLDELEKQDYSVSKVVILRYLSSIRALIDALPNYLFLILAMTPDARSRYFAMLPALAGRLQDVKRLSSFGSVFPAIDLYDFYLKNARDRSKQLPEFIHITQGRAEIISRGDLKELFFELQQEAERVGQEGVTQRRFLDALHQRVNGLFSEV